MTSQIYHYIYVVRNEDGLAIDIKDIDVVNPSRYLAIKQECELNQAILRAAKKRAAEEAEIKRQSDLIKERENLAKSEAIRIQQENEKTYHSLWSLKNALTIWQILKLRSLEGSTVIDAGHLDQLYQDLLSGSSSIEKVINSNREFAELFQKVFM